MAKDDFKTLVNNLINIMRKSELILCVRLQIQKMRMNRSNHVDTSRNHDKK